ncbi:MAG: hypothetical protein AAGJ82_11665, partial [Bacteroidota bacterium]
MNMLKKYEEWNWERIRRHVLYWLSWSVFFVTINHLTGKESGCTGTYNELWQWIAFEGVVLPIKITYTYLV